jgi:PEP-CTERM motif
MKNLTTFLAGVALTAGANATVITVTDSFGLATTNWTHLVGANQFNSSLGTLNSATFTFNDDIVQRIKAENTGAVADTLTPVAGATFAFRRSLTTLLSTNLNQPGLSFAASAYDGLSNFAGSSGTDFGDITATGTGSIVLTGINLAGLIGTGTLGSAGFDVRAVGGGSINSDNGNLDSSITTQARYRLTVAYDFTPNVVVPVPLPGSMALFGIAALGLCLTGRKAKKA